MAARQQAQLTALLTASERNGYRLRVALIASPTDLGSVTELWRDPQRYAAFLGQELSLVYRGSLLVVMPNGYGLEEVQSRRPAQPSALVGVPAPRRDMGAATQTAIQRLAAAVGHPLPPPIATPSSNASASDPVSWLVFAVGCVLILLAWIGSLRARPLGTRAAS